MANQIKEWAKGMRQTLQEVREYGFHTLEQLEDTIPFSESISAYLDALQSDSIAKMMDKIGLSCQKGLLLVGPGGSGKHRAATSIVATLMEQTVYTRWVWLTADDFRDMEEDKVIDCMTELFMPYAQKERIPKEIFLFEYLERSRHAGVIMEALSQLVQGCEENECDTPLILLVTEKLDNAYGYLTSQLMQFHFHMPNFDRRISYFSQYFMYGEGQALEEDKAKLRLSDATMNDLAEFTKGLNYTELSEFVTLCKLHAVYKAGNQGVWDADMFVLSDIYLTKEEVLRFLPDIEKQVAPMVTPQIIQVTEKVPSRVQNIDTVKAEVEKSPHFSSNTISRLEKMVDNNVYNPSKRELLNHKF